jgi:hypothetical protein
LVRDLLRARRVASVAAGERLEADDLDRPGPPVLLAGNLLHRDLLTSLMDAEPSRADTVLTIFPDLAHTGRQLAPQVAGSAGADRPRFRKPWLASKPFANPALATMLEAWIRRGLDEAGKLSLM